MSALALDNFPGYGVSEDGSVWSYWRTESLGMGKGTRAVIVETPKKKALHKNKFGYLTVGLMKNGKRTTQKVHRLVAAVFINNPHGKPDVNHIDGNKENNNVDNLEWATRSENMKHSWDNGLIKASDKQREAARRVGKRTSVGVSRKNGAKMRLLTIEQAEEIRALKGVKTQNEIANMHGVARRTVANIHQHITYVV